ncbi:uncharacterized protein BDZ99DRAFT_99098 [Mytilinidion resinicola]|uniref:Uncharacterized protein n=1 Tax=Mytilinidion resinicola TaxID=574789 RepID=A0A6A6YAG8_9PEZI|nr:uncharacterized protein BDZ99DRAFT_99098 [Mytilinidion resinicola]KAF2805816.1 hypothetical protein BDZ99DRAFT_99098 [Mytilinidion resinicola]
MQFLTVAAAALFAASGVAASSGGAAYVYNKCSAPVNLWSVSADGQGPMVTINAGGVYSEAYKTPSVGGVSLKLTFNDTCAGTPISQLEYTKDPSMGLVFGDMSNVNCGTSECPFKSTGWYLDMGSASCPTRSCAPNAASCTGAYIAYNDDVNTISCAITSDIHLYLCTDNAPSKRDVLEHAPHRHAHHIRHPHVRR